MLRDLICVLFCLPAFVLAANQHETYVVQKGDTLWSITQKFSHNPTDWRQFWRGDIEPKNLKPGTTVYVEQHDGRQPTFSLSKPHTRIDSANKETFTVQKLRPLFHNLFYKPRIDMTLKYGNRRTIGQIGGLVPLLQHPREILYFNILGMLDSNQASEGNFGFGYRYLIPHEFILGAYAYFDRRRSENNNSYNQLTLGAEILREHLELRGNIYLPQSKQYVIRQAVNSRASFDATWTRASVISNQLREIPLKGFDIEIGSALPEYDKLQAFVSYYNFFANKAKPLFGVRFRSNLNVAKHLYIEGEVSYDNVRKFTTFIGARLSMPLGKQSDINHLSKLQMKMTQFPVRDIDIVTTVNRVVEHVFDQTFLGHVPVVDKSGKFEGNDVYRSVQALMDAVPDHSLQNVLVVTPNGQIKSLSPYAGQAPLLPHEFQEFGDFPTLVTRKAAGGSDILRFFYERPNIPVCESREFSVIRGILVQEAVDIETQQRIRRMGGRPMFGGAPAPGGPPIGAGGDDAAPRGFANILGQIRAGVQLRNVTAPDGNDATKQRLLDHAKRMGNQPQGWESIVTEMQDRLEQRQNQRRTWEPGYSPHTALLAQRQGEYARNNAFSAELRRTVYPSPTALDRNARFRQRATILDNVSRLRERVGNAPVALMHTPTGTTPVALAQTPPSHRSHIPVALMETPDGSGGVTPVALMATPTGYSVPVALMETPTGVTTPVALMETPTIPSSPDAAAHYGGNTPVPLMRTPIDAIAPVPLMETPPTGSSFPSSPFRLNTPLSASPFDFRASPYHTPIHIHGTGQRGRRADLGRIRVKLFSSPLTGAHVDGDSSDDE